MLSENEIDRYSRQLILSGWGGREQERLKNFTLYVDSRYISAAVYLAAAGVGTIVLVGPERTTTGTEALAAHISRLNPNIIFSWPADLRLKPELSTAAAEIGSIRPSASGDIPAGFTIEPAGFRIEPAGFRIEIEHHPDRKITLRQIAPDGSIPAVRADIENHPAALPIPDGIDENLYAGTSAASFFLSRLLDLR